MFFASQGPIGLDGPKGEQVSRFFKLNKFEITRFSQTLLFYLKHATQNEWSKSTKTKYKSKPNVKPTFTNPTSSCLPKTFSSKILLCLTILPNIYFIKISNNHLRAFKAKKDQREKSEVLVTKSSIKFRLNISTFTIVYKLYFPDKIV